MPNVIAIYGSPRRKGNTALLLREAVQGARNAGAHVTEVVLRDLITHRLPRTPRFSSGSSWLPDSCCTSSFLLPSCRIRALCQR